MSAAAPARASRSRTRKVDLWRSGGYTQFQNKWYPHVLAITDNYTEIAILMLILRETEGWAGKKGPKSEGLDPEEVPTISIKDFSDWARRHPENIRLALKELLSRKIIRRVAVGSQSFRYFPAIEEWDSIAQKAREEWVLEQKEIEEAEAAAAEPAAEEKKKPDPPRKFGWFGGSTVAKTGYRSKPHNPDKPVVFVVTRGDLILDEQDKGEHWEVSISERTPQEKLGGKNGNSNHFNVAHDERSLAILRELLNRNLRAKLGPVGDQPLKAIASHVPEAFNPDLTALIRARLHKIKSWGFVIGLAEDVAHAARRDGARVNSSEEPVDELTRWAREMDGKIG